MRIGTWFWFVPLLAISACLDPLDLKLDAGVAQGISIDAKLVASSPPQLRMLAERLFNYDLNSRQRISMQSVWLENSEGDHIEIPQRGTGIYFLEIEDPNFVVSDGIQFRLVITTINGSVIESDFEPLWSLSGESNLEKSLVEVERIDPSLGLVRTQVFQIDGRVTQASSEPNANARMRWDMQETFRLKDDLDQVCYLTNNRGITNVRVFDTNVVTGVGTVPLLSLSLSPFMAEGYYAVAMRESLSSTALKYWQNLETVVERSGGQFEPTAGRLSTNYTYVSEDPPGEIFGFFYATTQDTSHLYISPDEAGNPTPFCLIPVPMGPAFPCGDCLEHQNSTLTKPTWWVAD